MIEYNWWLIGGLLLWLVPGVFVFAYAVLIIGVASKGRALKEGWGWLAGALYGLGWPAVLTAKSWDWFRSKLPVSRRSKT